MCNVFFFLEFERPKKLLIFINPVGGRKQANKIYKEKVNPLFTLADIKQDVIGDSPNSVFIICSYSIAHI